MTRVLSFFTAVFVLSASFAAAQSPAVKKPRALSDRALDTITAGSASGGSGGAIVANNSNATISETGAVSVADSAQKDSRALNLVNATDSAVANAVNVSDGRLPAPAEGQAPAAAVQNGTVFNVDQSNQVFQNMTRNASLPVYSRSEANIDEAIVTSRDITGKGEVDSVSEVLGQTLQGGKGFAGAASADLEIVGGSIEFTNNITFEAEAGTGFGIGGGLFEGDVTGRTEVTTAQTLSWILPTMNLHVDGVVCAVTMGSCSAEGSFKSSSSETRIVRSPIEIEDASAEYIVVDGSTLDVTLDHSVSLSGFAQQGARALNMVSAAGSAITNSVNVARSPSVGPTLNLTQVNLVRQGR